MDGPDSLFAYRRLGRVEHVDHRARAAGPGRKARSVAIASDLAKAHGVRQKSDCGQVRFFTQRHRIEAANRVLGIDRTIPPRLPTLIRGLTDELGLDARLKPWPECHD